jgi:signal transduction histidine kinase
LNWLSYHIVEEIFISFVCLGIAWRAFDVSRSIDPTAESARERKSRIFLICVGFVILGISSLIHAYIHATKADMNLLYQTLISYCFGLFIIIVAIASEAPWRKKYLPLLYLPLLVLLIPDVYEKFPIFGEFRPIVWIAISYFSGVVSILYISLYYHTRLNSYIFSSLGHLLICTSAIFLFFPTGIGSGAWINGHLMRPIGFGILLFSMNSEELLNIKESMLYKALAAFSLLVAIPLLAFGTLLFYDSIHPINITSRRIATFAIMLVTLASSLLFCLGLIIRLVRPVIRLKDNVNEIAETGFDQRIEIKTSDELGALGEAFNNMLEKLDASLSERDRLSRMAATGELAATLAHEIKNPLNAINGAAIYIGKNFEGDLVKEFVKVISDEVSRMNKLTTTLLTFAKPLISKPSIVNVNRLVSETTSFIEFEHDEQNLTVVLELESEMPDLSVDHNQIRQVLINLMVNAFDAVDYNGEIIIATAIKDNKVEVSVQDNGKGIKAEDMEKIFNPFFTTKTRGTGLGLAISKKVMLEHRGDLIASSTLGSGSTFTIQLPKR